MTELSSGQKAYLDSLGIKCFYYLLPIEHLYEIYNSGKILCRDDAKDFLVVDISDNNVQQLREKTLDKIHSKNLHSYVPLYFRTKNAMFYKKREILNSCAVLHVSRKIILNRGVVFTDGNATNLETKYYKDISKLRKLDWNCLDAKFWNDYEDGRRKICAELLVPGFVEKRDIFCISVKNSEVKSKVQEGADEYEQFNYQSSGIPEILKVNEDLFF